MITAIEYCRASTGHQEYSVGDQSRYIHEWAARNNYKIIKSYVDDGISGNSVAKRPAFLQMVEDITTGKLQNKYDVKVLLVWDSFRFARNMLEFLTYKQMIQQHGLSVIAVTEPIIEDDDAQLYIDAINGASGELYLRKLSKDSKRGIRAKVVNRHEHIGHTPYGYLLDRNTNQLNILEKEAQWVRYIFQEVLNGVPYLQICENLNDSNITTQKGYKWSVVTLKYVLTNKTYCGLLEAKLDGEHGIYEGKHAPIIPKETFDLVAAEMARRASKHKPYERSSNKYVHWLSGLLRCPYCGGSFSYRKGYGGRKPRYGCNSRNEGRNCKNLSIKVCAAESFVINKLKEIYDTPEIICELNVTTPKPKNNINYDAEIKKLKGQLTRAKHAYLEEIDTIEEYRENKAKLTAAINDLKVRKESADVIPFDPDAFRKTCQSTMLLLQSDASVEKKVAASHDLIDRIECDNITKKITIYFYA